MHWFVFMPDWKAFLQMGESAVGGGMIPPGLTPHAAAALQFWLSQGALNPHVHASYLHSLQRPFGEPLGHPFSGTTTALKCVVCWVGHNFLGSTIALRCVLCWLSNTFQVASLQQDVFSLGCA